MKAIQKGKKAINMGKTIIYEDGIMTEDIMEYLVLAGLAEWFDEGDDEDGLKKIDKGNFLYSPHSAKDVYEKIDEIINIIDKYIK